MKTLLVILSFKYPFEPPTEQFLHMELPFLNPEDTELLLVPYAKGIQLDKPYELTIPHKVKALFRSKYSDAFLGMTGIFFHPRAFLNEWKRAKTELNAPNAGRTLLLHAAQGRMFVSRLKSLLPVKELKQYDRVILYSYWLNPMAYALSEFKSYLQKKGVRKVVAISRAHGQGDLYLEGSLGNYRPFSPAIASGLDRVFSISDQGIRHLHAQGIDNTSVSRLGVLQDPPATPSETDEPLTVVSCSVVNDNKRVLEIAKAIAALKIPSLRWIHFGGGERFAELESFCREQMPADCEWILRGWTDHADIMKFYAEHRPDALINLSRVEGIPVSIMEAMSYGIPCVATDVGATAEILRDGENGRILPAEFTTEQVVAALRSLLCQAPEEREKTKRCAERTWSEQYCAESNFQAFFQQLTNL